MPGSREVVLLDPPDLVDDYLTVRLTALGRVARVTSRAFDDTVRLEELLDRTVVTDLVVWLPSTGDDTLVRRAVEALMAGVATSGGSVVALAGPTVPPERVDWFRSLHDAYPAVQLHLLRHDPLAGAFWDCRGELQTLATQGNVPLPVLASAVADVMTERTPGFAETTLTATQEIA
ncbi:hypothetical protein [Mumia sp. DW29H23]|uniref:hypothetical protein n=1 Tax=Mumia sp. DW29H23 TaxID=3421241 RepID=UPI003D697A04